MDNNQIALVTLIISIGGTLLTNFVGKLLSRRQDMAGVKGVEADAAKDLTEAAGAFIKPLREELDLVRKSDERNRAAIALLKDELENLKAEIRKADDAIAFLVTAVKETHPAEVETAMKIRRGELHM